jgi:cellulose synthase/poly-beta-1,6-N-acetylglucosamine synthase-like glycosyltransferase
MSGTPYAILAVAFWTAVTLTSYTYVGYPIWIFILSRWRPHRWRQQAIFPTVTVIVAVHNGASLIRNQVERLLSLDYPAHLMDIVVVSDGSTDGTDEVLKSIHHPSVKTIHYAERRGKAAALNIAMQNAEGAIALFVDIRPRPAPNSLRLLVSNFADPQVGCVSGELILLDEDHTAGAKAVGGLYWRYEQWIRKCESQVDSPLGVYGGFYAVRRKLAQPLPDATILDDMYQPLSVIRQGYRSVIDSRAQVYDVWPKSLGAEFDRKVRTLAGNFQLLQLAPWILSAGNRLRFNLVSHKLLRLLVPVLLVIMLGASAMLAFHSHVYTTAFGLQALLYLIASIGARRGLPVAVRVAGAARAFCVMNIAVVVGFYKFISSRGPLWKIWIPAVPIVAATSNDQNATPVTLG